MTVYPVLHYLMEMKNYPIRKRQDHGLSLSSKMWPLSWLLKYNY